MPTEAAVVRPLPRPFGNASAFMKSFPRRASRGPALLLLALSSCAAAQTQVQSRTAAVPDPYYIGASQAFTRETNLVRAPDGSPAIADTISTTSLLGGMDRTIGRQRVYFNGAAQRSRYFDNRVYDNTGYSLAGGLDWSTAGRVSGTLSASASEQLAAFAQLLGTYSVERNIVNNDQFNAVARVGTVTPLTLEGTYAHQRLRYSAAAFAFAQYSQDSAGFSLLWRKSPLLTLGAGARLVQGRYPQGRFGDDPYTGRNADLSVIWVPSALSSFSGRLSYNRTRHGDASQRDFSGVTGNLQWIWQASGRTRLNTQLTRATGEDASFLSYLGGSPYASGNFSRVTDTLALNAQYAASGKITLEGNLRIVHRTLDNTVSTVAGTGSNTSGADDTRIVGLTARYAATRSLQLSCNVGRDRRTASTPLSYPYQASYAGCSAQFLLFP